MHYLKPPLLHRDLKVENVLISSAGGSRIYKLCDFGSTAPPRPAATTAAEGRLIEDDVQRHTTLQYRSPEMIDVYRKQPIDEKSDIWALGVLLYKLCYYTTPFEEVGQMAILNASFKYPSYPPFSDRLKLLIATMLRENPQKRPNIYQVLKESLAMRGKEVPIRDIYSGRTESEARRTQQLPPSPSESTTPKIGAVFAAPIVEKETIIPDIAPMRRGRLPNPSSQPRSSAKPSPSPGPPVSSDPFSALDTGKPGKASADELAARFPTLDQFSLLHEKGSKFEFERTVPAESQSEEDLSKRVTNALADEAFGRPSQPAQQPGKTPNNVRPEGRSYQRQSPERKPDSRQQPLTVQQPVPQRPAMISTGTMTSSTPPPSNPSLPNRAIYRFPPASLERRASSQIRNAEAVATSDAGETNASKRSSFFGRDNKLSTPDLAPKSPASSRPSLEGSRPSTLDINDPIGRSKSANSRARPASTHFGSRPDFLRSREPSRNSIDFKRLETEQLSLQPTNNDLDPNYDSTNISSNVEYLRAKEEEDKAENKRHKRLSSGSKHSKRTSLSAISLSGTKTLLAGRFGDAFRRFEGNGGSQGSREPSPDRDQDRFLTPIAGSEATERSDDGNVLEESEEISPEIRRELERRRLSEEEKRVATAAAEYRQRLAEKGEGGRRDVPRAVSIQNKVQSLLQDNNKPVVTRTAAGYGKYTDSEAPLPAKPFEATASPAEQMNTGAPLRKVVSDTPHTHHSTVSRDPRGSSPLLSATGATTTLPSARAPQRPTAPPKPKNLRPVGPLNTQNLPVAASEPVSALGGSHTPDDWEANFSKRYPSLSGLELVETEIDRPRTMPMRTKEV